MDKNRDGTVFLGKDKYLLDSDKLRIGVRQFPSYSDSTPSKKNDNFYKSLAIIKPNGQKVYYPLYDNQSQFTKLAKGNVKYLCEFCHDNCHSYYSNCNLCVSGCNGCDVCQSCNVNCYSNFNKQYCDECHYQCVGDNVKTICDCYSSTYSWTSQCTKCDSHCTNMYRSCSNNNVGDSLSTGPGPWCASCVSSSFTGDKVMRCCDSNITGPGSCSGCHQKYSQLTICSSCNSIYRSCNSCNITCNGGNVCSGCNSGCNITCNSCQGCNDNCQTCNSACYTNN